MIERPSASSARARALTSNALSVPMLPIRAATRRPVVDGHLVSPPYGSSERMANVTLAGRSASRRMYHGYQCSP